MKTELTKLLKNNATIIRNKLVKMYPQHEDIINYHYNSEEPFNEWFAFLFDSNKWVLKGPIKVSMDSVIIPPRKYKTIGKENKTPQYSGLANKINEPFFDFITVVKPDNVYGIADGWHRFHIIRESGATEFTAYEWVKEENNNPIALEIRSIIINNIGK